MYRHLNVSTILYPIATILNLNTANLFNFYITYTPVTHTVNFHNFNFEIWPYSIKGLK